MLGSDINMIGLMRAGVKEEELIFFEKWFSIKKGGFVSIPEIDNAFNFHLNEFKEVSDSLNRLFHAKE